MIVNRNLGVKKKKRKTLLKVMDQILWLLAFSMLEANRRG